MPSAFFSNRDVMYLLDKLKPFEQKEHFSLKKQMGWDGIQPMFV